MLGAALVSPVKAELASNVVVENPLPVARQAETIEFPWAGNAATVCEAGTPIPSQVFEGKLLFQSDFLPGQTKTFTLSDSPGPVFPVRAYGRYVPERKDDYAWENDRIAFRIYGPSLMKKPPQGEGLISSGIDVWLKRTRNLVLDKWYKSMNYHTDRGEGLDNYHVGTSRGCGGIAVMANGKLSTSQNWATQKTLAVGPIRTVVELTYVPWECGAGVSVAETRRIILDAGANLNRFESRFDITGTNAVTVAVGMGVSKRVQHSGTLAGSHAQGFFTNWETEQKPHGSTATAILIPGATGETKDKDHVYLTSLARPAEPFVWYAGAGWSLSGDFADAAAWTSYVEQYLVRLKAPLKITFPTQGKVVVSAPPSLPASAVERIDVEGVMRVAARKLGAFDATHENKTLYPVSGKGANWDTLSVGDWRSGFYPGALWYLYEYARGAKWSDAEVRRSRAEAWTAGLQRQQFNTGDHDTGFRVFDSYGNGYRLTGNPAYLPIINQTAQSLAARFKTETGMIRSWGKIDDMRDFLVIIDNMMNLEMLVWASAHGGTTKGGTSGDLLKIAISHADHALEYFFRPDGSTYHVVQLNPSTGEVVRKRTAQGKANESTWSRGQTWAIYAFAYMYEATGNRKYLEASLKAADLYIARLPADFVPPADFDSEFTGLEFKDSSAAAIASSAFLRLHRLVETPELKKKYLDAATSTLHALTTAPYFSKDADQASLLVHAAALYKKDPNHPNTNMSLIFGDYYLLEALLQYQAITTSTPKHK